MDPTRMKYLASKGHFGHAALLDPETYVAEQTTPAIKPQEEEGSLHQAVRELPGDILDAFSPAGVARSAATIMKAFKERFSGEEVPDENK